LLQAVQGEFEVQLNDHPQAAARFKKRWNLRKLKRSRHFYKRGSIPMPVNLRKHRKERWAFVKNGDIFS
jgi:hypothetical protein